MGVEQLSQVAQKLYFLTDASPAAAAAGGGGYAPPPHCCACCCCVTSESVWLQATVLMQCRAVAAVALAAVNPTPALLLLTKHQSR
jgi:hypothetical protein